MTWNYRVLAHEIDGEVFFAIKSVYYEGNKPVSYSDTPSVIFEDSLEWVKKTLNLMEEATKKPILWANDKFPKKYYTQKCGD